MGIGAIKSGRPRDSGNHVFRDRIPLLIIRVFPSNTEYNILLLRSSSFSVKPKEPNTQSTSASSLPLSSSSYICISLSFKLSATRSSKEVSTSFPSLILLVGLWFHYPVDTRIPSYLTQSLANLMFVFEISCREEQVLGTVTNTKCVVEGNLE